MNSSKKAGLGYSTHSGCIVGRGFLRLGGMLPGIINIGDGGCNGFLAWRHLNVSLVLAARW